MKRMDALRRVRALSSMVAAASLSVACGGGGSDPTTPPPPPASFDITGRAVDGALQGAIACLDTNDNRACDSSEPTSGTSAANGSFTISVSNAAQAGAHRVIVNVPASAIDADTGAVVGAAFTMTLPATGASGSQTVFVSPLTTLVSQQMDASGQSRSQAADFIQQQAGLAVSPLADFTGSGPDNLKAANVAKLALKTSLQQTAAVVAAVGQNDVSGSPITQADLDRAVLDKVVAALPVIGAAAVDPAVVNLTGTAREQALTASAAGVVAGIGFTPEQARFVIGIPRIPQPAQSAPVAGANMSALQYTNAATWFYRYNAGTAADNTPGANGLLRYYSVRVRNAPYAFDPTQGVTETNARTDNPELHWSGSAWTACEVTDRNNSTPRDSLGRNSYDFCRNHERGNGQRAEIDIGGQSMASVWTDRILVEQARTSNPGAWSLPSTSLLGGAVFPAGSRLGLQSNTITETAITYNTVDTNRVDVAPLAVAQGGDARATSGLACASPTTRTLLGTLETLIERNPGRPCIFGQETTDANGPSLSPNEVWGNSTVSMGTLATNAERPAGTANYYTTTRLLRVSFPSAGNTVYWACLQRTTNLASRNCTQVGSGTYTIATLGDARVMTFNNLPAAAQAMGFTRVFVERGGAVYFGFKNRVGAISTSVRLNMTAANALLYQLGMPAIQPVDAPQALTGAKATNAALLNGVWTIGDANGASVLRFGPNGEYVMGTSGPADVSGRPGIEQGWVDVDLGATQQLGLLTYVDSNNQFGLSHPLPTDRISSLTDTAITFSDGSTLSRLPDPGTGIVGMWALGSATDFKTTHFVFFGNGKVLSIHPAETQGACATARQGPPGVEWSDYSFNATTGVLTFSNRTIDTSGCTGVWDATDVNQPATVSFTITLAANGRTFTAPGDGGTTTNTFYRITPNP